MSYLQTQIRTLQGKNDYVDPSFNPAIDRKRLTLYVGLVAFLLPTLLLAFAMFNDRFCSYDSISHYYFAPMLGSYFVGCLGFITLFLLSYVGHTVSDMWMSAIGGIAAAGVAIFPTSDAGCTYVDSQLARAFVYPAGSDGGGFTFDLNAFGGIEASTIHFGSAAALFLILAWFCIWSFRRNNGSGVSDTGDGKLAMSGKKQLRNLIYLLCGLGILAAMAVIGLSGDSSADASTGGRTQLTFWAETVALYLFAVSWLVKGRIINWIDG